MSANDGRLFDLADLADEPGKPPSEAAEVPPGSKVVRIVPDVAGLDRSLDYLCPPELVDLVQVGAIVRIELGPRRVDGWVIAVDVEPGTDHRLRTLNRVLSIGPNAETIALAHWAARRWSGRLAPLLKAASPNHRVKSLPALRQDGRDLNPVNDELASRALAENNTVQVTIGPGSDRLRFVLAAARRGGGVLVLTPNVETARRLSSRLQRLGLRSHLQPAGWAAGASGGVVVGSRAAVWAPVGDLSAIVVLDEHDDAYHEQRTPTWNARDVAIERARRAGIACILISATPSTEATAAAERHIRDSRSTMRKGWPIVDIVDQRDAEPGQGGLFPSSTISSMRKSDRIIAVLNRKGRAQVLACASCGELVRTGDGEHLMVETNGELVSLVTGETRPLICAVCTGTKLKRLRLGVTRAAEELTVLLHRPVAEVTASTDLATIDDDAVIMGTAAALYRIDRADVVAFVDLDQELHAPRLRAAEQAMALIGRAARIVGGRRDESRLILQTRNPDHRVIKAAKAADVTSFIEAELAIRRTMSLPPFGALALMSGPGAEIYASALNTYQLDHPDSPGPPAEILGPRSDGRYLLRAKSHDYLCDLLEKVERPRQRLRVEVDPTSV